MDAESSIEEKPLTTEGSVGGESGLCEVETNQEPYEGMLFMPEHSMLNTQKEWDL